MQNFHQALSIWLYKKDIITGFIWDQYRLCWDKTLQRWTTIEIFDWELKEFKQKAKRFEIVKF